MTNNPFAEAVTPSASDGIAERERRRGYAEARELLTELATKFGYADPKPFANSKMFLSRAKKLLENHDRATLLSCADSFLANPFFREKKLLVFLSENTIACTLEDAMAHDRLVAKSQTTEEPLSSTDRAYLSHALYREFSGRYLETHPLASKKEVIDALKEELERDEQ